MRKGNVATVWQLGLVTSSEIARESARKQVTNKHPALFGTVPVKIIHLRRRRRRRKFTLATLELLSIVAHGLFIRIPRPATASIKTSVVYTRRPCGVIQTPAVYDGSSPPQLLATLRKSASLHGPVHPLHCWRRACSPHQSRGGHSLPTVVS